MVDYSLKNGKIVLFFLLVLLVGGVLSFDRLGKKEDAPFVIKQAVVFAHYPGALAKDVEQKVTRVIEQELQTMPNIYRINSDSYFGMAKISLELQPYTPAAQMQQMWDILRRKMLSVESKLPEGVQVSINDDFGDVYGLYFALVASQGYSYQDLRFWSKELERQLSTVEGVQRVEIFGSRDMVVSINVSSAQLASLSITPDDIASKIASQNRIISCGKRRAGGMELLFYADGVYKTLDDIENQVLISNSSGQVRISDIATVDLGYTPIPSTIFSVNGKNSVGIAISSPSDVDVVKLGSRVRAKLQEIEREIPLGLDIEWLYSEDEIANEANVGFIINLVASVAIVIFILLLALGVRTSLLIGSSLIFSISGTLLIMQFMGVGLNRTSLAGFIIAMGMLVDNAIVVADNGQNNMLKGMDKLSAIKQGANSVKWGLLGATLIAIFSFLPLYLAKASVAEIVHPLFVVIALSLMLSWVLSMVQTTYFSTFLLNKVQQGSVDRFSTPFYRLFRSTLSFLIRFKYVTTITVVGLLVLSLYIMGRLPQNFFPSLDKPYFRAEFFLPNGYSIFDTEKKGKELERWLLSEPSVKNVSVAMGSSPPRYYLASAAFGPMATYGSILVELTSKDSTKSVEQRFNNFVQSNFPNLVVKSSLFKLSPVPEAAIEIGVMGQNIDTLVFLTNKIKGIMLQDSLVDRVRDSWGAKIAMVVPRYSLEKGGRLGVTRQMMAQSFQMVTEGVAIGRFGYDDAFLPIMLRDKDSEEFNLSSLASIPIFAPNGNFFPLGSVTSSIDYKYSYYARRRYNHSPIMLAQCEAKRGVTNGMAFNSVWNKVREQVVLPEGYVFKFKGEMESQEESNAALAQNLPLTLVLIFITLLLLFRSYKKSLVILAIVPLIFIGVVLGLVLTGKSFNFFSILGLLGLIGMCVKNGVVLIDQISVELEAGKSVVDGVLDAASSRLMAVVLAAGTTIVGMAPLLADSMFGGMAATIMGGLFMATLLTLFVLPVFYLIAYGSKISKRKIE